MAIINNYSILPTGGAIMLFFTTAKTGNVTITRTSQTTNTPIIVYNGPVLSALGKQSIYLDTGDDASNSGLNVDGTLLNTFLNQSQLYVYTVTDSISTATSPALQPAGAPVIYTPDTTATFMKLLQIAISTSARPAGISAPYIAYAAPEATFEQLPFITIYSSKFNQADQPIGADFENTSKDNTWTIYEQAIFEITVAIFSTSTTELQYFRDNTLALMKFIRAEYFGAIGADSWHNYTSDSYLMTQQNSSVKASSLSRCDIKFQFKAENNCTIQRTWGLIEHIDATASDEETGRVLTEVVLP